MESLALLLFVVCCSAGMLCVALFKRWLMRQTRLQQVMPLDTEPAPMVGAALTAGLATAAGGVAAAAAASSPSDDEPTQPMTRTDTAFDSTDWPTTLMLDLSEPEAEPETDSSDEAAGFAETMPFPVESAPAH